MEIPINVLAVILAALSTMVVGWVWYTPSVFGNAWMKLGKVKPNDNPTTTEMIVLFGGAFLGSVVTAAVLAYLAGIAQAAFGGSFLYNTLLVAFVCWLGFTAARLHMHDSFEGRRKKFTLLNTSHEFVTIAVMALIIGVMQ